MAGFIGADRHRMRNIRQCGIGISRQWLFDHQNVQLRQFGAERFDHIGLPAFIGIDDQTGIGRRITHRRDPVDIALTRYLEFDQGPPGDLPCRGSHRIRRIHTQRVSGDQWLRRRHPGHLPGWLPGLFGRQVP